MGKSIPIPLQNVLFYEDNMGMRICSFSVIYLGIMLLLSGCASHRKDPTQKVTKNERPKRIEPIVPSSPTGKVPPPGALWEVLKHEQLSLQLKNLDDGTHLSVNLLKGLSTTPVTPGHWEITGFEDNGKSFLSMNTSKRFVFLMKKKTNVYAGSIVIGCPQIASTDFKLLKEMKFFNRYPFSSSGGICEMVVGNNFAKVKTVLKKSHKNKKLNLVLGF